MHRTRVPRRRWSVAALVGASVLLAVASCGGGSATQYPSRCNVTITGGPAGTYPCVVTAIHDNLQNRTGFAITSEGVGAPLSTLDFEIDLGSGDLQAGVYDDRFTRDAKTGVSEPDGKAWLQAAHAPPGPDQGSYSLHVTSTGALFTTTGATLRLSPRGTLDATLPAVPGSGASGTVTVHATF